MTVSSHKRFKGRLNRIPWKLLAGGLVLGCSVGAALYYGTSAYFTRAAEERVLDLLLQNRALHEYIQSNTHPALYEMKAAGVIDSDFYSAELLSSTYMARHVAEYLNAERSRNGLPEVVYRISALNPRNQVNAANQVDSQLIEWFNNDRKQTSVRRIVTTDSGEYLQVSLPFLETGEACLRCHGTPSNAPRQLVEAYGAGSGFNAEPNWIRAIETIEAPLKSDLLQARILFGALLVACLSMISLVLIVSGLRRKVRRRTVELAASEQKYRTLVEDLPCFACAFLPDGTLTYANKLMAEYFLLTPDQMIGRKMTEIVRPDVWQEAVSRFTLLTADAPIGVHELQVRVRDGSIHWQHWIFRAIFRADGTVAVYQAYGEDVTERKQAEETIRESEARFSTVFHASPIGILITRIGDGCLVDVNEAFLELSGYSREEVIGHSLIELGIYAQPSDRNRLIQVVVEQGSVRNVEGKMSHKSGEIRDLLASAELIRLNGEPHMLASVQDICERKRAEQALRESEQRHRSLLNAIPDTMALLEQDGTVIDFRGADNGLDMPGAQLMGHKLDEAPMLPEVRNDIREAITAAFATGKPQQIENDFMTPNGVKSVEARFVKYSDSGVLCLLRNVTDRKQAEEALRNSERSYLVLSENLPCAVYRIHLREKHRIEFFNDWITQITGYGQDEVSRSSLDFLVRLNHPDDRDKVTQAIAKAVREKTSYAVSYRLIHRGGSIRHLLSRGTVVPGPDGSPLHIDGVTLDLTEKIQTDEALRQSEEKYRSYVDNAPDAVMVVDRHGRLIEVNPTAERMTGYSRPELLGMSVGDLLDLETGDAIRATFSDMDRGGEKRGEILVRRKNGNEVWWSVDGVRLSEDRYLAFCVDVTETRRLRELESRAQRLETAGRIAGQVAHDFNNLLAPLTAYPDMIREDLPKDHPALAFLSSIEESAQQIAEINQQLLTLGRRGHYNQEPMNLNEIVHQVLKQMEAPPVSLAVDTDLADDLMLMLGGRSQVHRVLMNLVQNARESMQDVGRISIRTENFYVDELSTAFTRVPRGEYVKLTISDTGCGIPAEIIKKVFDPFFTTKMADRKRGSGLGLSVVDAVVNDHRGFIDLSSRAGEGTSIYLYFPITREDGHDSPTETVIGGDESVLVVDDDKTQREVCTQILTRLGYRVEAASGGEEALASLRVKSYDLLIIDMIMPPGLDGAATYRRSLEINPNQRAIILSGFAESGRVIEAQQTGAGAFLRKPVTRNILARAVRRELDRTAVIPVRA